MLLRCCYLEASMKIGKDLTIEVATTSYAGDYIY